MARKVGWEMTAPPNWEAVADALAEVLRKNGVGGRAWGAALDLYDDAKMAESGGCCLCRQRLPHTTHCNVGSCVGDA